jgi:hypothetical protein
MVAPIRFPDDDSLCPVFKNCQNLFQDQGVCGDAFLIERIGKIGFDKNGGIVADRILRFDEFETINDIIMEMRDLCYV